MARSPIPAEVWAEARELYGSLPRGKAVTATVDLLARRGYAVKPNTVTQHMSQRGVTVAEGTDSGAYWTEAEDDLLRQHAGSYSARLMQERFFRDRTISGVVNRARILGVALTKPHRTGRSTPMLRIPPQDGEMRAVYLGDAQVPEQSWEYHRVACGWLSHFFRGHSGAKYLFLIGDMFNATVLGRFAHDPNDAGMEEEIAQTKRLLEDYVEAAGKGVRYVWIDGNHEYRCDRFIQTHPEARGLIQPRHEQLEFDRIFGRGNWDAVPYLQGLVELPGDLLVTHGYKVSQHSAYSAKAHVESTGMSVIHGHTHRAGVYVKTLYDRTLYGIENGSGCEIQSYVPGVANWQLAFTYTRHWGERWTFGQAHIHEGRANIEGRWFGVVD